MNREVDEREWLLQQQAGKALVASVGGGADEYRYVDFAVRHADIADPPPDFAAQMQSLVADYGEQAGLESWIQVIALVAIAGIAIVMAVATIDELGDMLVRFAHVPWRLVLAAAAGLSLAAILDRLFATHRRQPSGY